MRNIVPLILKSSFQNELMKIGSWSEMILRGKPWSLHTVSMNRLATLKVVNWVGKAPKWMPLENLSTMTRTVVNPRKLGRCVTKSMERSSETQVGIRIGCSNPTFLRATCLTCWHTTQLRTKVLKSLSILGHWKLDWRRCKVFLTPKWPPTGVAWYSCSRDGMNGFWESNHMAPLKRIRSSEIEYSGYDSG